MWETTRMDLYLSALPALPDLFIFLRALLFTSDTILIYYRY